MMRKIFGFCLLTIALFILNTEFVTGQDIPSIQDIATLDVDELSDDQIAIFIEKVESSGYSEDQLLTLAKSRGMSELQIQKLRTRIGEVQGSASTPRTYSQVQRLRNDPESQSEYGDEYRAGQQNLPFDPFGFLLLDSLDKIDELKVFGLNFFENSQLTFETGINMPTPANYIIGAGDEIIIDVWGASEQTYQLMVSPEGAIRVPSLGPIYISGLKVEAAKSKVISRLKRIYSSIGNGSYADVTLGQIRSINVHVIGEAKKPGTYTLSSFSTAFNALYSAGGPTENGSLRKIEVYRSKKLISVLDAYEFLIRGTGDNITLEDQDVLIIRSFENRITFDGEVKNPAYYELIEGETFDDLLLYSGGFTQNAYRGIVSVRRIDNNKKTVKSIPLDKTGLEPLFGGDEIYVGKISENYIDRVTVEGPVENSGEYQLTEGMTLLDLIGLADGLRPDTYMLRGIIIRQNIDYTLSNISFDPIKILDGSESIALESNDIIKFQSIYDMRSHYKLNIEGAVQQPGDYAFISGMTVEDLIYLSGGFKESAAKSFVEVARRINPDSVEDANSIAKIFNFPISKNLSISEKNSKFQLAPFDLVVVRESPFFNKQEVIEIEGEVVFPGIYALDQKDERISSIIKRAGGLTKFAFPEGATLIRRTEYYREEYDNPDFAPTERVHLSEKKMHNASRIRMEDLTYLFKKDTVFNDSAQIFRQRESIGINLEKIVRDPGGKYDLILREGDILSVPREYQTVRIRGEVLYPSNTRHDASYSFKDFVASAGGFGQQAKRSKSYIIYANGSAAQTKSFLWMRNYPKVEPGAEIVIPRKPDREPLTAQAWVALASSVATFALVVDRLL